MMINDKPVRLLLRGDYKEAAQWIPYFAGICRAFAQANETRYQQRDDMRGKAQVIGGQCYIIDITAGDEVLYYTLVAGDLDGALNRFVVMAWPERPKPTLERAYTDPEFGSDPYGSAYISRYDLGLFIGYASFLAVMARCGRQLYVFFSSNSVTPMLIRYRRVRSTATLKPTVVYPVSNDTWAQRACLYRDALLLARVPVSLAEANWNNSSFSIENTGVVRATLLTHQGAVLASASLQLAEPRPYPPPPATSFANLVSFRVCRGQTAEDSSRPTYWLAMKARTDATTQTSDEPPALIPLYYRLRYTFGLQRRDRAGLAVLQAENGDAITEAMLHPGAPEDYTYPLGLYVPFFEIVEGVLFLIVGRLYANIPYDLRDRNDGKDLLPGDRRVHLYDCYQFDPATLELLFAAVDCGYARIAVRNAKAQRRVYVHGFDHADFAWVPDSNPNVVYRTLLVGSLWQAEMTVPTQLEFAEPLQITMGEKVCDTGYGIKGPLGLLDYTEVQTGFVPEFDD